jgi:signal transduction histidine kinase
VRVHPRRPPAAEQLRHRVSRLVRIPLRPLTARTVIGQLPEEAGDAEIDVLLTPKMRSICEFDPGWMLSHSLSDKPAEEFALIAATPWWPGSLCAGPAADFLGRLWRHSAAVRVAARTLASEANDPDPNAVARAGLLCRLGLWAVAAVDPEWLVRWWHEPDAIARRQREVVDLGTDLDDLGRRLAERWGCDSLTVDAAWLHGSHGHALLNAAREPARLAYIQQACRWVEQTPWSLGAIEPPPGISLEPRLRILIAEVQARTASAFVAADVTHHEERMTRQNANLRLLLAATRRDRDRGARFLAAMADSIPDTSPEDWAARAAMSWCAEPGVSAARLVWPGQGIPPAGANEKAATAGAGPDGPSSTSPEERPPAIVLPLTVHGKTRAQIHLWTDGEVDHSDLAGSLTHRAWQSWAGTVVHRTELERKVRTVVEAVRQQIDGEEDLLQSNKLEALAEFAAGAGHELNNPLAVIVGRAQLLLARTDQPETARSLRIILSQAGRAHRILRDLIFVARPPAPRPRPCRPAELLRACLRDLQDECTARGIRLTSEIDDVPLVTSIDPDALRHLGETLLRNAIQATPAGGKIVLRSNVRGHELSWSFADSGQGISPADAAHLFDPFYCGRQAGRGLGLGLPRAARLVAQAGGRLQWSSSPGHGTNFQVHFPLSPPGLHEKANSPHPAPPPTESKRPNAR